MVAKCANPSCSAQFLYLSEGKIYVLHVADANSSITERSNFFGTIRGVQYAWLCDTCAKTMKVILDVDNEISVVPEGKFDQVAALLAPCVWIGLAAAVIEYL